ncbi:hypothetical protein VKT23_008885 [Stygiomarasmius scandens]|uniref:Uncharacterized protein n=1 Tax=Marasmiellus scandens TaxID=2682957 RepID=A0ABR1JGP4_9AGAR
MSVSDALTKISLQWISEVDGDRLSSVHPSNHHDFLRSQATMLCSSALYSSCLEMPTQLLCPCGGIDAAGRRSA